MKIAHISDLHLGKMLHGYSLIQDQEYIFDKIIEILVNQQVEILLVAGDIFDKSIAPVEGIRLFRKFLNKLVDKNIKVLLISGNHDSAERLTFGSEFMEEKGIYFSKVFDGNISAISFEDKFGKVNFYLLPFIKPTDARHYYPDVKIESYSDAIQTAIKNMNLNLQERNVIVSHQNIMNAKICESEEHIIGGLDAINAEIYKDFDYTALGHIHTPQKISEKIIYCGSPIKYSISEMQNDKSIPVITLENKGDVKIEFFPLKPLRDIREIRGNFAEIISMAKNDTNNMEDFINIILTDENTIPDAISTLKSIYPNILQLTYDNSETKNENSIENIAEYTYTSPLQLFAEFYKNRKGIEMDSEQKEYLTELIEKIWGEENETN